MSEGAIKPPTKIDSDVNSTPMVVVEAHNIGELTSGIIVYCC